MRKRAAREPSASRPWYNAATAPETQKPMPDTAADVLRARPGAGRDDAAVGTALARLRTALGTPKLIQTVVKRGYRLALDPAADAKYADV